VLLLDEPTSHLDLRYQVDAAARSARARPTAASPSWWCCTT
jgi:ABC-type hemin transport system ATPase subunit